MIDLHTHTLLSDGQLVPAEQIRRAQVRGYRILGLADHADLATIPMIVPVLVEAARCENELGKMTVLGGIELTHVRPEHIARATALARKLGAMFVIAHGQTIAEPVEPGTNRAAIEAGVDILAHPGLITEKDAALAAKKGVLLEISGKAGHCLCNGHVAATAKRTGATLIFGSDAHEPAQMPSREYAEQICLGAGMDKKAVERMFRQAELFAKKKLKP
ncbi:MAG: histidinol phosphate phosphatase domain-containing protein [Planctomycetes bacterium]|nr:histidinol phosphate phosphatase domain-containing protein [Planctomycetota bacterium]